MPVFPPGSTAGQVPYAVGSLEPYKLEVYQQCFAVTEAWNRAIARLSTVPAGGPEAPVVAALQIISDLQGFSVAVGVLSDLFFPTHLGDATRGAALRALYGVAPNSPLSGPNIKVRHSMVHIDERLDRWLRGQVGKVVGPLAIQPWSGPAPSMDVSTVARIIDNVNWRLMVLGEELEFRPLLLEVGRISTQFPLEWDGPSGKVRLAIAAPS